MIFRAFAMGLLLIMAFLGFSVMGATLGIGVLRVVRWLGGF